MDKYYGDYVCSKCATIAHHSFEAETEHDAIMHTITCPVCGREGVQMTIPTDMKAIIKQLIFKGYHVFNIFPKTLGVVIQGRFEGDCLEELPHEFVLDCTEEIGDIIVNGRMQHNDYEGIEGGEEQYRIDSIINLLNWVRKLPEVGKGRYVDMDKMENEKKEEEE